MMKSVKKLGNFFNPINSIYEEPKGTIILMKDFLQDQEQEKNTHFITSIQHCTGSFRQKN